MCDQSAEQQREGLSGRQELAMSTLRCRRGLPYGGKVLAFRRRERVPCSSRSSKSEILAKLPACKRFGDLNIGQ